MHDWIAGKKYYEDSIFKPLIIPGTIIIDFLHPVILMHLAGNYILKLPYTSAGSGITNVKLPMSANQIRIYQRDIHNKFPLRHDHIIVQPYLSKFRETSYHTVFGRVDMENQIPPCVKLMIVTIYNHLKDMFGNGSGFDHIPYIRIDIFHDYIHNRYYLNELEPFACGKKNVSVQISVLNKMVFSTQYV